jgi:hypothetical protein
MLDREKLTMNSAGYQAVSQDDEQRGEQYRSEHDSSGEPTRIDFKWWVWLVGVIALVPLSYVFIYLPYLSADAIKVPDLARVDVLPEWHVPDHKSDSKLILIGDVHGNLKELKKLLKKADYNQKKDHFVLLGDFITKGEDSLGVINFAIDNGASCVRGNHEDKILNFYTDYRNLPPPRTEAISPTGTPYVGDMDRSKGQEYTEGYLEDNEHIIHGLRPRHIEYLGGCSAILELGKVSTDNSPAVAVHAGLVWNIETLREQDPEMVMRIRSLLPPDYIEASEDDEGEPWIDYWNKQQKKLPKSERTTVFYGHNARRGLELTDYTKGLDSGCVKGDELSAIVITQSKKGKFKHKLYSVDC